MILTGLGGGTPGGATTQLQFHNAGVFGGIAGSAWNGSALTLPALTGPVTISGGATSLAVASTSTSDNVVTFTRTVAQSVNDYLTNFAVTMDLTPSVSVDGFEATSFLARVYGNQNVDAVYGVFFGARNEGTGTVNNNYGQYGEATNNGAGTITNNYGLYSFAHNFGAGTITNNYGVYADARKSAGTIVNTYNFYGVDLAGHATNGYYFWMDSRGVYRIREDNVADGASFPQAIPAGYNPRFAKYVAGAPDYERWCQQWAGNVFQIGTQAGGGASVLRGVEIIGASLTVPATTFSGNVTLASTATILQTPVGTTAMTPWRIATPTSAENTAPFELYLSGATLGGIWDPSLYYGYNASAGDITEPVMRQVIEGLYRHTRDDIEMYWEYISTDRLTTHRPIFYARERDGSTFGLTLEAPVSITGVSGLTSLNVQGPMRVNSSAVYPFSTTNAYVVNGPLGGGGVVATSGVWDTVVASSIAIPSANSTATVVGYRALLSVEPTGTITQSGRNDGVYAEVIASGSGTGLISDMRGISLITANGGSSAHPVTAMYGAHFRVGHSSAATVGATYCCYLNPYNNGAGAITSSYGAYITAINNAGTVTNDYGLYVEDRNRGATLNYALYTNLGLVRFGDVVSIQGQVGRSAFTIVGATQTASFPVLDLTQTWNNAGTVFTFFKGNVTNTASASGSLVADLQVGSVSMFNVDKAGNGFFLNTLRVGTLLALSYYEAGIQMTGALGIGTTAAGRDTFLTRGAAAVFQMGHNVNGAAVAQTFKAHDGITGTNIAGANLTLAGGRGTGTGAPGNLIFQTAVQVASGTTAQTLATRFQIIENKIGLFGVTPVVQPATGGAASTFVANTSLIANDTATFDGYTIGQVVKALRNLGALA